MADWDTGAYPRWYQKRRRWRKGTPFLQAILATIPSGCTVYDLGAGPGHYVRALRAEGYLITGVDGTPGIEKLSGGLVLERDLTGPDFNLQFQCEWAICLDVGEHVPKEYEQVFINHVSLVPTDGLIVSWGEPGTRGTRHVNCQTVSYVVTEFSTRGWYMDREAVKRVRGLVGPKEFPRLMIFRRKR